MLFLVFYLVVRHTSLVSTSISKPTRLSYESKEQELLKLSIAEQIAEEEMFKIIDFKDLTERLHRMTLPDNYIRWNSDSDTVYLLQLSGNGHNVSVASSIVISSSLGVRAFLKGESIELSLGIISDIRQIETIVGEISGKDTVTDLPNSIHKKISKATELLNIAWYVNLELKTTYTYLTLIENLLYIKFYLRIGLLSMRY